MSMDSKTEIIAHFIGVFEKVVEAARMRAGYEEFAAAKAEVPEPGSLLNIRINVTSPYAELGTDPSLPGFLTAPVASRILTESRFELPEFVKDLAAIPAAFFQAGGIIADLPLSAPVISLDFQISPPSSVATVNLQNAFLWDEDSFANVDLGVEYTELTVFHSALQVLSNGANGLQVVSFPNPPTDGEAIVLISEKIAAQVFDAEAPEGGPASVYFAKGIDAVAGVTENGASAEEIADFKDLLPEVLREEDETDEEEEEVEAAESAVFWSKQRAAS